MEKILGQGWIPRNLQYVHQKCACNVSFGVENVVADNIDLFEMLEGFTEDAPADESPYKELTEFFRLSKHPVIHMGFEEIEHILGARLPWEAYCFEAFWYDDALDQSSAMWRDEGFPFGTFQLSQPNYSISHSWTSQDYKIKSLVLASSEVTFRIKDKNTSGIVLPKALTSQRLPDDVVYDLNKLLKHFVQSHGL